MSKEHVCEIIRYWINKMDITMEKQYFRKIIDKETKITHRKNMNPSAQKSVNLGISCREIIIQMSYKNINHDNQ